MTFLQVTGVGHHSNAVYVRLRAVTITSGPCDIQGEYTVDGNRNGKKQYNNCDTGAWLYFKSDVNRWTLVLDDAETQYSSSDNANRDMPWSEAAKMDGSSWRRDAGEEQDDPLHVEFKGMHTSSFPTLY